MEKEYHLDSREHPAELCSFDGIEIHSKYCWVYSPAVMIATDKNTLR